MGKWGRSSGVAGVQELQNAEGSVMVVVVVVAKKDPVGKPPQSSFVVVLVLDLPDLLYRFRSSGLVIANTPGC
jgi:hypothetical protein